MDSVKAQEARLLRQLFDTLNRPHDWRGRARRLVSLSATVVASAFINFMVPS